MRFRRLLAAIFLLASLGVPEGAVASGRHSPFWACSDGKGTVSLFWLPPDGRWPAGGFLLERISRGKATFVAGKLAPAEDAESMALLDPADAAEIRILADKIRTGNLTDDDRNRSITVTGRNAAVDLVFGRALGVRYADRTRVRGKIRYRLKALDAGGRPESTLESNDLDPGKATPPPGQPKALKARPRQDGVALYWQDPSAGGTTPVVAFHIARSGPGRKVHPLTSAPLVLNRHMNRGAPEFLDAGAPRETMTYRVQSVDVFGRRSASAQTRILGTDFPALASAPVPVPDRIAAAAVSPARKPAGTESIAARPVEPVPAAPPAPSPVAETVAKTAAGGGPSHAATQEPPSAFGRTLARMETIVHPPSGAAVESPRPVEAPPAAAAAVTETGGETNVPPTPVIVGIRGTNGKVTIEFAIRGPEKEVTQVIVLRSEYAMTPGHVVGRPVPPEARQWEDNSVEPGQNLWYRLVTVNKDGKRSLPTNPRWVRVGPR